MENSKTNAAPPIALTIAGSDSSGGAGIQADLKTFSALGVYGASAITALTAQNTCGVSAIHSPPPEFLAAQLNAVFDDLDVSAVKIGMVGAADAISVIVECLSSRAQLPIIVDPVMVATTGASLLEKEAEIALRDKLLPLAEIITPNSTEAARLLGEHVPETVEGREDQAKRLLELGPTSVLITGGEDDGDQAIDIYCDSDGLLKLSAEKVDTQNTHGTGCTLSSAIVAYRARGVERLEAVRAAKAYVTSALKAANQLNVGKGAGPVHHFYQTWK